MSTYDDWKLMSDRDLEPRSAECTHTCPNDHVVLVHAWYDEEGLIPNACDKADKAQPLCEECSLWVDRLVTTISDAAKFLSGQEPLS